MRQLTLLIIVVLFVSGCTTSQQTARARYYDIVDPMSVGSDYEYQKDFNDCTKLASYYYTKMSQDPTARFITGAIIGAAAGALVGKLSGQNLTSSLAIYGALYGGTVNTIYPQINADRVFSRCMFNKGYTLLW